MKFNEILDSFSRNITKFVVIFLVVYAILPILSPVFYKVGLTDLGHGIQYVYRIFCHQRVERSAFLFGNDGIVNFYSREELKAKGVIPEINPNAPTAAWNQLFYAYPYVGNEEVGYKMAYCIRDFGLYVALAFTAVLAYRYMSKNKKILKFPWLLLVALMLPMAIDGLFQTYVEIMQPSWLSPEFIDLYLANIPKRIITGGLFGVGFGLFVIPNLFDASLTSVAPLDSKKSVVV